MHFLNLGIFNRFLTTLKLVLYEQGWGEMRWANGTLYGPNDVFYYSNGDRYYGQWSMDLQEGNVLLISINQNYFEVKYRQQFFMKESWSCLLLVFRKTLLRVRTVRCWPSF